MTAAEGLPPLPGYRALFRTSGKIVEQTAAVGPDGHVQNDPVRVVVELDRITAVLPRAEATT